MKIISVRWNVFLLEVMTYCCGVRIQAFMVYALGAIEKSLGWHYTEKVPIDLFESKWNRNISTYLP